MMSNILNQRRAALGAPAAMWAWASLSASISLTRPAAARCSAVSPIRFVHSRLADETSCEPGVQLEECIGLAQLPSTMAATMASIDARSF